jgi:hypothetical protein
VEASTSDSGANLAKMDERIFALPCLIERWKWFKPTNSLSEGDNVIMANPKTPRGV